MLQETVKQADNTSTSTSIISINDAVYLHGETPQTEEEYPILLQSLQEEEPKINKGNQKSASIQASSNFIFNLVTKQCHRLLIR
jgi:hypothetical protein